MVAGYLSDSIPTAGEAEPKPEIRGFIGHRATKVIPNGCGIAALKCMEAPMKDVPSISHLLVAH